MLTHQQVPLTPKEIDLIFTSSVQVSLQEQRIWITRAIEASHGITAQHEGTEVVGLSMDLAPTDGTMVRLLVEFEGNSLEDSALPAWTVGASYASDGEGIVWQFAGWDWSHDRFTQGYGKPIAWLPMISNSNPTPATPE